MAYASSKTKKQESFSGTICVCFHCGEHFGSAGGTCSMLCKLCKTAEQREAMHEANRAVTTNYECKACKWVAEQKSRLSQQEDE